MFGLITKKESNRVFGKIVTTVKDLEKRLKAAEKEIERIREQSQCKHRGLWG